MNELTKYLEENLYPSRYNDNLLEAKCENNQIGNKIIEWFKDVLYHRDQLESGYGTKLDLTGVYGLLPLNYHYEEGIIEFSVDCIEEPHGLKNVEVTSVKDQNRIYVRNTLYNRLFRRYPKYSKIEYPVRTKLKFITCNKGENK